MEKLQNKLKSQAIQKADKAVDELLSKGKLEKSISLERVGDDFDLEEVKKPFANEKKRKAEVEIDDKVMKQIKQEEDDDLRAVDEDDVFIEKDNQLPHKDNYFRAELGSYHVQIRAVLKAILYDLWQSESLEESDYFEGGVLAYVRRFIKKNFNDQMKGKTEAWNDRGLIERMKKIKVKVFSFGGDGAGRGFEICFDEQLSLKYFFYKKENRFRNKDSDKGIFPVEANQLLYKVLESALKIFESFDKKSEI